MTIFTVFGFSGSECAGVASLGARGSSIDSVWATSGSVSIFFITVVSVGAYKFFFNLCPWTCCNFAVVVSQTRSRET